MDRLSDLPEKDTKLTEEEDQVITKYFGDPPKETSKLKTVIFTVLLFLLLANPVFDGLLNIVPTCSNTWIKLSIKTILFCVGFYFILQKF